MSAGLEAIRDALAALPPERRSLASCARRVQFPGGGEARTLFAAIADCSPAFGVYDTFPAEVLLYPEGRFATWCAARGVERPEIRGAAEVCDDWRSGANDRATCAARFAHVLAWFAEKAGGTFAFTGASVRPGVPVVAYVPRA